MDSRTKPTVNCASFPMEGWKGWEAAASHTCRSGLDICAIRAIGKLDLGIECLVKLLPWPLGRPSSLVASGRDWLPGRRSMREARPALTFCQPPGRPPREGATNTREGATTTNEALNTANMAGATEDGKCAASSPSPSPSRPRLHLTQPCTAVAHLACCLPATTSRTYATSWAIPPLPLLPHTHHCPCPTSPRLLLLQTYRCAGAKLTRRPIKPSAKRRPTLPAAPRSA